MKNMGVENKTSEGSELILDKGTQVPEKVYGRHWTKDLMHGVEAALDRPLSEEMWDAFQVVIEHHNERYDMRWSLPRFTVAGVSSKAEDRLKLIGIILSLLGGKGSALDVLEDRIGSIGRKKREWALGFTYYEKIYRYERLASGLVDSIHSVDFGARYLDVGQKVWRNMFAKDLDELKEVDIEKIEDLVREVASKLRICMNEVYATAGTDIVTRVAKTRDKLESVLEGEFPLDEQSVHFRKAMDKGELVFHLERAHSLVILRTLWNKRVKELNDKLEDIRPFIDSVRNAEAVYQKRCKAVVDKDCMPSRKDIKEARDWYNAFMDEEIVPLLEQFRDIADILAPVMIEASSKKKADKARKKRKDHFFETYNSIIPQEVGLST